VVFESGFLFFHFIGFRQNQVSTIGFMALVSVLVGIGFDLRSPLLTGKVVFQQSQASSISVMVSVFGLGSLSQVYFAKSVSLA